jgi:hypothetical protein
MLPALASFNRGFLSGEDDESWLATMAWTKPLYGRPQINRAAKDLVALFDEGDPENWNQSQWERYSGAVVIINHWRACHAYPLNALQVNLRRAATKFDESALIAQRTKRLVSIGTKLLRRRDMKLTQMQDIGGCRAVVKSIAALRALDHFYRHQSRAKHEFATRDDYVASPQHTGYRGIHFVYRFFSNKPAGEPYNGLKIEIQLRSQYQHAWATAVETVGTFIGHDLKGGFGPNNWLRFFQLMGSVIARRERAASVPNTPDGSLELQKELSVLSNDLSVETRLTGYTETLQRVQQETEDAHWYLLRLDTSISPGKLTIIGFRADEYEKAQSSYAAAERPSGGAGERVTTDAVLVSVGSLADLPRAYPNYFADTRLFLELLRQALAGQQRRIRLRE